MTFSPGCQLAGVVIYSLSAGVPRVEALLRPYRRRRAHLVLVAELERVDDTEQLGEVTPRRRGVGDGQADLLGGVDWRG